MKKPTIMKKRVTQILQFIEKTTDCYVKDMCNTSSFHGTIGQYGISKKIFAIYNYIQTGDYGIAYQKEIDFINELLHNFRLSSDFTELIKECQEIGNLFLEAHKIFQEYVIWNTEERKKFKEYLFNNEFLKEEEKTEELLDKFSYEWVDLAKKSVQSKLLKIYNFGNPSDKTLDFNHTIPYIVSDAFCISDNINVCIGKNLKPNDEKCFVNLGFKIDKEILYSYFVITVHYKDKTWLITDKPSFANPRAKECRRNPYRIREEAFDNIMLPYGVIDDIEEWRKESKSIAKQESSEIYIKSIKDYLSPTSKILFKLIIEELIYNIIPAHQHEFKRIGLVSENIKLIGTNTDKNLEDNVFININKEANDKRVKEILLPPTSELIEVSASKAIAKYVDSSELCTIDELHSLAVWAQKEEKRRNKQKILDEAYTSDQMRSDEEALNKIIFDNIEKIYAILLSGNEVYMTIKEERDLSFGIRHDGQELCFRICNTGEFKSQLCHQNIVNYKRYTFRSYLYMPKCLVCDHDHPAYLELKIFSYKQLCPILQIPRQELPLTFQNYMSYHFIPYEGNTILDNVNPEYRIIDRRSYRYRNYYTIGIPLNKRCYNTLKKKYFKYDKSHVIIDYENNSFQIQEYDQSNDIGNFKLL